MLTGLMQDQPLLISQLIEHADRHSGDALIVSRRCEGDIHRYTYHEAHQRSKQMAQALTALGIKPGERVATLAWNGYRHFELYFGISGMGAVLHTINPRLHPEQIAWITQDAQDQYLFFDITFTPIIEAISAHTPSIKGFVAMTDRAHMPATDKIRNLLCYEELIAAQDGQYTWPVLDELSASSMCYTSGTTGNPKGVLYSHRSTILHTFGAALPDGLCLSGRDSILPVVPMFHVNAWGIPYICAMVGAKVVFPGPKLDGASVYELMESEQVNFSAGVPTVWGMLLGHLQQNNLKFSTLKTTVIGGAAAPPAMIRAFQEQYGVEVLHAWGMTEMSPLGTVCRLRNKHTALSKEEQYAIRYKQGKCIFGVDMKIVADGVEQPWDGKSYGDLLVKGPWVVGHYFNITESPLVDGWFPTGDVATIDPDGYMQITDRSKDVIKSGGEWISTIDLENHAVAHPAVAQAAVIGIAHPKWDERPLLIVVLKPGQSVTKEQLLAHYEGKIAKWWLPDDVAFVDAIPLGATGKILKTKLREQFNEYVLPTA